MGIVAGTVFNFTLSRQLVFRASRRATAARAADLEPIAGPALQPV
jgi:putative flippase GtrA